MKQKLYFLVVFFWSFSFFAQQATHLNFDGINDIVTASNPNLPQGNSPRTIEAWVKTNESNSEASAIFSYGTVATNQRFGFSHLFGNFYFVGESNDLSTTSKVNDNLWHHVAASFDGTTLRLYFDGVQVASAPKTFATTGNNIFIAHKGLSPIEHLNGNIDEVRIWNVARTAEQIFGSKNCELQGTESGLVAYYKFNQGIDQSNNSTETTLNATAGTNGTLTNFTLNGATSNWLAGSPVTSGSIIPSVATVTTPVVYTQGGAASPLTATIGANGNGLLWYTSATGGVGSTTAPTPSTATVGSTSYWVASTNANGCGSARTEIVVTVYQAATHLNFDGVDDLVNCGNTLNSVLDPLNKITVEAWVKSSTNTGLGVIVGNYANPNQTSMQFLLRRDNNSYAFWIQGTGTFKNVTATNSVILNTWQHVAGVWNGSDLKIYIDGVLAGTTTGVTDSSFASTTNSMFIGNNQFSGNPEEFTGSIEEVRIWNFAKTIEQINGAKNCELQGSQTGLIAYYNFNQGNDAQNNSGVTTLNAVTGPNGTLTNFALNGTTSNWLAGSPVITGSIVPSVPTVSTPVVYTQGDTASPLTATTGANGTGLLWYTTATGGTGSVSAPTPSTATVGSTSYWVTSTNANGCESPRTVIVVTVNVINNECPNATNLTVGTSSFNDFPANVSLTGATNSGTPVPTCGNFQGGDVWYTATVPASGNIVIETNGVGNYDTGLEVYTGVCGALSLVSCDDNNGNGNYSKIAILGQTPGTVLRIRVWENFFGISNAQFQVSAYDYIVPATHLNFDGVNDLVNCGNALNSVLDPLNKVTVEAWVKPSTNTGLGVIVGNYASPTGGQMQLLLRRDNASYTFWVSGTSGVFKVVTATNSVVLNTWQHVAGVWNGSDLKIYINGVLAGTTTGVTDSSFFTTSNNLWIGNNQAASPERFTGDIDEVRLWNIALTQIDIQDLMNCEAQAQPELLAYYKFNQGNDSGINTSTTSLTDSSGNGYTGTLSGFTLSGTTSNWKSSSPVSTGNTCSRLGTDTFNMASNIKVYPNPSKGNFTISLEENATITVNDMLGKIIYSAKVKSGNNTIDISNYQSGIYLLNVKNETGSVTKKIIKE